MKTAAILAVAGAASFAAAQSATVGVASDSATYDSSAPGILTITISLDAAGLAQDALGLAGWNIAVDVSQGTVTGASYVTATAPLIDQNNPFGGDPAPEISGNTVNFSEGLNAFSPASAFHTGGALATITIDTTGAVGDIVISSRLGDSPLGAFTAAGPGTPPFSYVGTDFSDGNYGAATVIDVVPAPASAALLGLGGLVATRRRR